MTLHRSLALVVVVFVIALRPAKGQTLLPLRIARIYAVEGFLRVTVENDGNQPVRGYCLSSANSTTLIEVSFPPRGSPIFPQSSETSQVGFDPNHKSAEEAIATVAISCVMTEDGLVQGEPEQAQLIRSFVAGVAEATGELLHGLDGLRAASDEDLVPGLEGMISAPGPSAAVLYRGTGGPDVEFRQGVKLANSDVHDELARILAALKSGGIQAARERLGAFAADRRAMHDYVARVVRK